MLPEDYIPKKPFQSFKWKWASLQCTESLNDPVILLGVLFRMRKLELLNKKIKYSSHEFESEMYELSHAVSDSIKVDLCGRVGERNLIRNSGQYWRAVDLISSNHSGYIELTDFGRKVADREISQTEFSAITIQTFKLPNPRIQSKRECELWNEAGLSLYPLKLLLDILYELAKRQQGYITPEELTDIIIPLSGVRDAVLQDYVNFIQLYRTKKITLSGWPNCAECANDSRIAREFLLFLSNYGYLDKKKTHRDPERYDLNSDILPEIDQIIHTQTDGLISNVSLNNVIKSIQASNITYEVERKRIQQVNYKRPNQAGFRRDVLKAYKRCVITNMEMPEILQAAHIKPFKYKGEDTVANGLALRVDIHILFDSGHLRISPEGEIFLSSRAREDYGRSIPPQINIPSCTNPEFLKWRWENYNGI